jgi:hypothetical protein
MGLHGNSSARNNKISTTGFRLILDSIQTAWGLFQPRQRLSKRLVRLLLRGQKAAVALFRFLLAGMQNEGGRLLKKKNNFGDEDPGLKWRRSSAFIRGACFVALDCACQAVLGALH